MIITFCGHSDFNKGKEYEGILMHFLESRVGDGEVSFYLGGYGAFDRFALAFAKKYQERHQSAGLFLITPYLNFAAEDGVDGVIYPEIEDKPLKLAIVYRNRWMIEKSDIVIAYVEHEWGGAYQNYRYALRLGKEILNLAEHQP